MAIVNGNNLIVSIGGTTIGVSQSCSISFSTDIVEQNSKDNPDYVNKRAGRTMATISCNGLYDAADGGQEAVHAALGAGTSVSLVWGISSDEEFSCSAILTSVELTGDENADGTYSYTFESTGVITRTINGL